MSDGKNTAIFAFGTAVWSGLTFENFQRGSYWYGTGALLACIICWCLMYHFALRHELHPFTSRNPTLLASLWSEPKIFIALASLVMIIATIIKVSFGDPPIAGWLVLAIPSFVSLCYCIALYTVEWQENPD